MPQRNALPGLVFIILFALGLLIAYPSGAAGDYGVSATIAVLSFIVASILANSVKVANQWERVVVLRLGRFQKLAGPGLFFIIPIIDMVAYRIDIRVITSTFKAEKAMTRDTVPVDVDAVLFWKVVDPKMAALDVADYVSAINWAAQTALRDVTNRTLAACASICPARRSRAQRAAILNLVFSPFFTPFALPSPVHWAVARRSASLSFWHASWRELPLLSLRWS